MCRNHSNTIQGLLLSSAVILWWCALSFGTGAEMQWHQWVFCTRDPQRDVLTGWSVTSIIWWPFPLITVICPDSSIRKIHSTRVLTVVFTRSHWVFQTLSYSVWFEHPIMWFAPMKWLTEKARYDNYKCTSFTLDTSQPDPIPYVQTLALKDNSMGLKK